MDEEKFTLITYFNYQPYRFMLRRILLSAVRLYPQRDLLKEVSNVRLSIYPVPVRENNFTIKTDKDISYVKITNIIGQDIFKEKYSNPTINQNSLDNPKRGMYLVTIIFSDGTRVVKKIMVEESE